MAVQNGQVYWDFDLTEDVVSDRQDISSGLFSGEAGTLSSVFTSSTQTASSGQYYIDVYNVLPTSTTTTPEVQFAIAYGHKWGSGSLVLNQQYPSRAIYSQYRNVLLEPTDEYFTFNSVNKSHIIAINFNLAQIKQTLDPGNWQLALSGSTGKTHFFIDDSNEASTATTGPSGRVFNVVSGTIAAGPYSPVTYYGQVYPDIGIMVLDPDQLSGSANVPCNNSGSNVNAGNHWIFYKAISGSMQAGNGFIARNVENIASTHYFVRVKNAAFNFSNNPTFLTGSLGDLYHSSMVKNPTVYITEVGMYNDDLELLAVAKLSQPLKKTFANEALIRVKLDY